jgi:hypothetical protein
LGKIHSWLVGGPVADHIMLEIYCSQCIKQSWILFKLAVNTTFVP